MVLLLGHETVLVGRNVTMIYVWAPKLIIESIGDVIVPPTPSYKVIVYRNRKLTEKRIHKLIESKKLTRLNCADISFIKRREPYTWWQYWPMRQF